LIFLRLTEERYEGLLFYTKEAPTQGRYGQYYPIRFIGNGDLPHSEVTHRSSKEVPSLEVEHPMSCELESRAKSFLSEIGIQISIN